MPSRKNVKIDHVAEAVATWLKQDAAREPVDSIEQQMEKNREESKLFAQFLHAELAKGQTMGQAVDEWYARLKEAKAEKEAKRQAEAAIFEKEYRARLAASYPSWEAFERAEQAVAVARWEAKRA